ncbi:hypothetical protein JCM4814A_78650 [Streptomyces phaeofaciens JCM 4814]|uniref:Uncharacterized protein n=1 Tax=Streptomyces phaeofaciens TaxID=68254 RepID=A0A918HQG7_9ACTN|nr:hypothetical protein [Streptomyces phaeofaciens]GGT96022.1 hypothetical protein GCM10010226_87020 [Streptomyces phaeofaciens]
MLLNTTACQSAPGYAKTELRLLHALWEIAQDLQSISRLATLVDASDTDEDLIRQAIAAVTTRVEAIETEADQLLRNLEQDEKIRAESRRSAARAETERRAALRKEALLDAAARAKAGAAISGAAPLGRSCTVAAAQAQPGQVRCRT